MNETQGINSDGPLEGTLPPRPQVRRVSGSQQEMRTAWESIPTEYALNSQYVPPVAVGEPRWLEVCVVDLAVAYPNLLLASA
jgi:hypothetical protein